VNTYRCQEANDQKLKKLFLRLPAQLYGSDCPQDVRTEKQLLQGTHPLSSCFEVIPFVITDGSGKALCRCMLTYYPDDETAYLGFFEAYNDPNAVQTMFRYVEDRAAADGKRAILGPVDASIYINYRFKIDRFDKTYTGEPFNKPYYPALWKNCGFSVCDRYVSNQLRQVEVEDIDPRLSRIYDRFLARGYRFVTPQRRDFSRYLADICDSMMHLYAGFTGYKPLTQAQFVSMFSYLKYVLNFDMVKLVYKEDKLKAFGICLPNYGVLTWGRLTPTKLLQILKIRKKPKEYIILYVGAEPDSSGLGGALVHDIRNSLYQNGCTAIGALIKEGNVTGEVYDILYTDQFRYVLLSKEL
jgi:hypothetical protein